MITVRIRTREIERVRLPGRRGGDGDLDMNWP